MSSEKVVFLQCVGCLLPRQVTASYYQEEVQQYKGQFDHLVLLVNIGGYVSNNPHPKFSQITISVKLLHITRGILFSGLVYTP